MYKYTPTSDFINRQRMRDESFIMSDQPSIPVDTAKLGKIECFLRFTWWKIWVITIVCSYSDHIGSIVV